MLEMTGSWFSFLGEVSPGVWAGLLVLGVLVCWGANLFSIPASNWVMVGLAALYAWQGPAEGRFDLAWAPIVILVLLAGVGELIEFTASALGARKVGGSRRSAALSMVGSIVGGLGGMVLALPIPVIGPIVGALLFASAGALGGAMLGERWKGRDWEESLEVGKAAFWGRLLGTVGKAMVASVMVVVVVVAVLV